MSADTGSLPASPSPSSGPRGALEAVGDGHLRLAPGDGGAQETQRLSRASGAFQHCILALSTFIHGRGSTLRRGQVMSVAGKKEKGGQGIVGSRHNRPAGVQNSRRERKTREGAAAVRRTESQCVGKEGSRVVQGVERMGRGCHGCQEIKPWVAWGLRRQAQSMINVAQTRRHTILSAHVSSRTSQCVNAASYVFATSAHNETGCMMADAQSCRDAILSAHISSHTSHSVNAGAKSCVCHERTQCHTQVVQWQIHRIAGTRRHTTLSRTHVVSRERRPQAMCSPQAHNAIHRLGMADAQSCRRKEAQGVTGPQSV